VADGAAVRNTHAGGKFSATCKPVKGTAPLTVLVTASGRPVDCGGEICASIDLGDGLQPLVKCAACYSWEGCDGDRICAYLYWGLSYTFACPGTYTVTAQSDCAPCQTYRFDIEIEPARFYLGATCDPTGTTCGLFATGSIDLAHIVRSTIDWGDGGPIEEFTWRAHDGWFEAPSHDFGTDGYFTVRVANEIVGTGCAWTQSAVVIANPGYTTPVVHSTWGKIKMLYAK
jgi:hypothetical protein